MKLLTSPWSKPPSVHARLNVSKLRRSGIEKPVTRSLLRWNASRRIERIG